MKAIILAAGKATRLLPLTKETPQCLLKVNQKTILERQVETLKEAGIDDITVITGHLSEKAEQFCKAKKFNYLFNPFYEVSGMASTLWVAKEQLKNGFIFLYSDVLFDSSIVEGLLRSKGEICLAIKKNALREEAEKVIEKDGIIQKVSKIGLDSENGEFIGIAKFSSIGAKALLQELDNVLKFSLGASFIQTVDILIKKEAAIAAYDIQNSKFIDIDFPEDIAKAEKLFK